MSSDRPSHPPRRSGGRGRPGAARPGGPRRAGPARGRPAPKGRRRPPRPQTAAERRAAEVNAKRAPRPPRDPEAERARIESRTLEQWVDEGDLRSEASSAAARAAGGGRRPNRHRASVRPDVSTDVASSARDARRAEVLTQRLGQAQEALDRERFDEARRLGSALVRDLPDVAAVHEVIGLAAYRSQRWKQAAAELELAHSLKPSVELLPVLADSYRALKRWGEVERIWAELRAASPAQEVMAEGRIVAAGAQADQGDLRQALRTMSRATHVPKRVRDHHLRQWYVLGDLHDRAGDTLDATRWFELVAKHDADFVDVRDRLRALGR
jgi:tetratricopeptide (TPR) repeat protein